ncbi:hypothetical protein Dsin_010048 [Dipteronia sinensis]|uniref:EF-hand domain-containing protein n=1 Tax=Dipteronia sinensis TaxID=43782 RepID=A0AAE0AS27_9ROSI|nr:hypothetical protein Dsin_010048 [Dipteronia sinensis]
MMYNTFHVISYNFQLYLQPLLNYLLVIFTKQQVCNQKQKLIISPEPDDDDEIKLSKGDIKFVMGRLGFNDYSEFEGDDVFGAKELTKLFEEKEPSLEELKQAFDVFDVNKDGFIDETELQRVLCRLGLISSSSDQDSQVIEMIRAVDANGDGRIDFDEFVTFMDKCFC